MPAAKRVALLAACVACAAISGCALSPTAPAPTPGGRTPSTASTIARAQTAHEVPSPAPPAQTATGGAPSATQAIRAFATRYINWSADTVARQMRALASASIGQARSATALAAAQTARDYELQRGGIANSGTVEAIAPLVGGRGQYVVVTRELTSATNTTAYQGLRPAWHLALATATQLHPDRWVLSRWQPQS